jgi:hypothetical protein
MRNNIFQKTIFSLIAIIVAFSPLFIAPKTSLAVLGAGDTVIEVGPSLYQQIANTANSTATSFSTYSIQFKEFVLDGLAVALTKQIIRQLTSSIVNWINSGFEGSPSFISDPGSFFLDVADQVTGAFLSKYGGPLVDLCSPFSIDIRLALAFKYRPYNPKRYTCTLNTIIKNSKNAVEGASINGFTAGDFRQGGWPAFVTMTTEPQNNQIGAYLEADNELSIKVANAQIEKKQEINQGRGFLSWKECKNVPPANQIEGSNSGTGEGTVTADDSAGSGEVDQNTTSSTGQAQVSAGTKVCTTKTPGSVIEGQLQNSLGGPLRELELADEINEIVNALFAQLVTQVLQKGLSGVSGSGSGDNSSYINQIQKEANDSKINDQLLPIKTELLKNIETYIQNTVQFRDWKNKSFDLFSNVTKTYESAKACYATKMADPNLQLSITQKTAAQGMIDYISGIQNEIRPEIGKSISQKTTELLDKAKLADDRLNKLNEIKTKANSATTVNEINEPSRLYGEMLQNQSLTSAKDIVEAQQEYDTLINFANPFQQDANRRVQECGIFPTNIR